MTTQPGPGTEPEPNPAVAMACLEAAGIGYRTVAVELAVAPATAARWRHGHAQPRRVNLVALRALADDLTRSLLAENTLGDRFQLAALAAAREALMDAAERAVLDRLAARIRNTLRKNGTIVTVPH